MVVNTDAGSIFPTLHFLHNLEMIPISWSATLHRAGKDYQEQTLAYWADW